MDWNGILNWRLLSGSHQFPGPDGGTCINEAAIVAAGFQYSAVRSSNDCPPCFSRVLSSFAILLNDRMSDDLRQSLLLPFVTRLAGTADTPEVERQRFDFIMVGIVRNVLPILLHGWKDDLATECAAVANYDDAIRTVNNIALDCRDPSPIPVRASAHDLTLDIVLARDLTRALDSDVNYALFLARALALANDLDFALGFYSDLDLNHHTALVALLDGAMKIGKQAEPIKMAWSLISWQKSARPNMLPIGSTMTTS